MKVMVKFIGPFCHLMGVREIELETAEGLTLKQLLYMLDVRLGRVFSENITGQIETNDKLRGLIHINGKTTVKNKGLDIELKDGDIVSFLPPMAGG